MRFVAWILAAVLMVGCTAGQKRVEPTPKPGPTQPAQEQPKPEQPKPEQPKPEQPKPAEPAKLPTTPAEVEKALGARAREAVEVLKSKDMEKLAALVHPEKGVRFTPYSNVDKQKDLVFKAGELKGAWVNKRLYLWGNYDGSGDPINLGFADYYAKFVYDVDFASAPKIGWNESIGQGNSLDNWRTAYPEGAMVEFHFPGFNSKYAGMDWRSLRLVFEQTGNQWYLVGIIHAQWTI
ncbi:MAG TPA: hypothetical protein VNT75_31190 [Symbiobacteriaceae bacterium]|nr:hypothetical protein [Symbiobacteriaceae bacterium]